MTYYPQPPAPPPVAPPPQSSPDTIYVPGYWFWQADRYLWRAGYWAPVRQGFVWVPSHYRWTPSGYVFIPGYWDLAVARRGVLYAPVVVNVGLVGPRFVFTPGYAVCDAIVLDALFIRPAYCHYYFVDYYGPRYVGLGFTTCVVYSRTHYEPIFAYRTWENRGNPAWINVQINLVSARNEGRVALPPRTLVEVRERGGVAVLAPARTVIVARGGRPVPVMHEERVRSMEHARAIQVAAVQQRRQTEVVRRDMSKPHVSSLNVPSHTTQAFHPNVSPPKGPTPPGHGPTPPFHGPTPLNKGPTMPPKGPTMPPKGPQPKGPPAHKPPPKKEHH